MTAGVEISARHPQENPVAQKPIGIIGASSVVAEYLTQVLPAQYQPLLFSRSAPEGQTTGVAEATVPLWISVMPIWATPNYFGLFLARGARRVVAVSSTSRFTKARPRLRARDWWQRSSRKANRLLCNGRVRVVLSF